MTRVTSAAPESRQRPMRADARRNYERLLDVARAAFAEHGADASLDDIARQAGVGSGTLYRHFPNRDALLEAVAHEWIDELHAEAQGLLADADPGAALTRWLRGFIGHVTTYRGLAAALICGMGERESPLRPSCGVLYDSTEALLASAVRAGQVRPDVDTADVLRLVNAIALATERAPDRDERAACLLDLIMNGIRHQDG